MIKNIIINILTGTLARTSGSRTFSCVRAARPEVRTAARETAVVHWSSRGRMGGGAWPGSSAGASAVVTGTGWGLRLSNQLDVLSSGIDPESTRGYLSSGTGSVKLSTEDNLSDWSLLYKVGFLLPTTCSLQFDQRPGKDWLWYNWSIGRLPSPHQ